MSTTFPGSIMTFPTMQDMTASDGALVAQYQAAMQSGDLDTARTILASITNNQNKIVTADLLNQILDTTVAVEKYFGDRYSNGYILSETQPTYQATGDYWFEVESTS